MRVSSELSPEVVGDPISGAPELEAWDKKAWDLRSRSWKPQETGLRCYPWDDRLSDAAARVEPESCCAKEGIRRAGTEVWFRPGGCAETDMRSFRWIGREA